MNRFVDVLKRWWPIPAFIVGSLVVQVLTRPQPTPVGHAAGHYGNATVLFAVAPLIATIIWASPSDLRRRTMFWVVTAAIVASAAVAYAANMRIVTAIGGELWTNEQAGSLGPTRAGFEAGHVLSGRAEWASVAIVIVFALFLGRLRVLSRRTVAAAIVISIILPPWIFASRGILVIAAAFIAQRSKRIRSNATETTETPLQSGSAEAA